MNRRKNGEGNGPLRVALYLRQSLDATGEGMAVARQRVECERYLT